MQSRSNSLGFGFFPGTAAPPLNPDASAYIARMVPTPDAARQTVISNFFQGLQDDGVYNLLDRAWLIANTAQVNGFLNILAATDTLTAPNGGTYTVDRGWNGDGVNQYIDTGFVPSTDGVNYTQNSASLGYYLNAGPTTAVAQAFMAVNTTAQTTLVPNQSSLVVAIINGGGALTSASATRLGFTTGNRSSSTAREIYRNGVQLATGNSASTGNPSASYFLAAQNNSGTPGDGFPTNRYAFAFAGGSLTSTQHTALYNRLLTYLTALGAQ